MSDRRKRLREAVGSGVLGGGGLNISTFIQSPGPELLTNGGFETGDPPTGWTQIVAILSSVADPRTGSAGAKAINVARNGNSYSGAFQAVTVVAGAWHELDGWARNVDATSAVITIANNPATPGPSITGTTWTEWQNVSRRTATTTQVRGQGTANGADGTSQRYDDFSYKRITLNTQQTAPSANGTLTFTFTLPASPVAGQMVHLLYRISGTAEDAIASFWDAYLKRNDGNTDWDFRLDDCNANTVTNRVNVTGVGTVDAIRVTLLGNDHTCYTGVSNVFTQRGLVITNTLNATAKGLNTVYSSAVTPVLLISRP